MTERRPPDASDKPGQAEPGNEDSATLTRSELGRYAAVPGRSPQETLVGFGPPAADDVTDVDSVPPAQAAPSGDVTHTDLAGFAPRPVVPHARPSASLPVTSPSSATASASPSGTMRSVAPSGTMPSTSMLARSAQSSMPPQPTTPSLASPPSRPPVMSHRPSVLVQPAKLRSLLGARVRLRKAEAPFWTLLVPVLVLAAAASIGLGFALSPRRAAVADAAAPGLARGTSGEHAPATAARPPQPAGSSSLAPVGGDTGGAPTSRELLAVETARLERERSASQRLRETIERDPALLKQTVILRELRDVLNNPQTAPEALAAIANVPGELGSDLLYEVWTGSTARTGVTELARSLLYSADVRPKASRALAVALDLRVAQSCEAFRELLPLARQHADRRSLRLLAKLQRRQGCGQSKHEDCYQCLREGGDLAAAIKAARSRRAPAPFAEQPRR